MKQTFIAFLIVACSLFNSAGAFADGDSIGIIPGKLAWSVDSIVEQWTLTKDIDGQTIEQTHYDFSTQSSDNDRNSTPSDQRYNRKLVITLGFINLGSETYRFDNSSRLEVAIKSDSKTIRADAQPMTTKTVIAPNGRVKKCSFVLKMNNRAFIEEFDNRASINDLLIYPASGKLNIENAKGDSLLDNVQQPASIAFFTKNYIKVISVFPEPDNEFTLKDALSAFNKINRILMEKDDAYEVVAIDDNSIDSVFGIPVTKTSSFMGSNAELPWLVAFMFNDNPVDNYNTSDVVSKTFRSKDVFKIGVIPTDMLNEYLPLDETGLLIVFSKCIEKMPESVAPKRYQEVNIKSFESLSNPYQKLKEYAQSGDNEAIEVIFREYNPESKRRNEWLSELFPDRKSFFLWLKPLADKGYCAAQLAVGLLYENGVIVKENLDKALKYYKMAAEKDDDKAMVCYAIVLLRKDENNKDEAAEWFRKAAERKNPRGQYMLSLMLLTSQDDDEKKEGIVWLQQSAFQGEPDAMFALALEYTFGRFIPRDEKKAFALMERLALEKGFIKAFDVLGDFYMQGIGVERDGRRAVICYSVGAEKGIPNSMYWYGRFLCDGFNVEKDVPKGYAHIKEAAMKENAEAMLFLGLDYYVGKIAKKNNNDAFFWIEKAAKAGNENALAILGDFFMEGVGVKPDKAKAFDLYKIAARAKNPYGVFRLGQILYEEKGPDAKTGLELIKTAAKMGNQSAQEYLDNLDNSIDDEEEVDEDSEIDHAPNDDVDDLDNDD